MPRPHKPYLQKEYARKGDRERTIWYVRIGKGPRIRLRAKYGTPEFNAEYQAAVDGKPIGDARKPGRNTIAWAIRLYMASGAWAALSPATRRQRQLILAKAEDKAGGEQIADITKASLAKNLDKFADRPAAGRHFLDTMRHFLRWAVTADLIPEDPSREIVAPKKTGDGFEPWEAEDCAAFEARWPLKTRQRLAYAVLRYTGLRKGDAVLFGPWNIRDGVGRVKTEKTGERVAFVIDEALTEAIEAGQCGKETFISNARGAPMQKTSFGNWFRDACDAAGVDKSAHGLRKTAATKDAEDGWSESELEAKYGWRGGQMASKYTRKMNREKLSLAAAQRVKERTSIPAPVVPARATAEKD